MNAQKDYRKLADSLRYVKTIPYIENCTDPVFWKIVNQGLDIVPALIDKMDDTRRLKDVYVLFFGGEYTTGDVAYVALQEIIADILLKEGSSSVPEGLDVFWGEDGIGKSNVILLKRTLDILKIAKSECESLPLSEALGFFFQKRVNEGLLQNESTADFLSVCNHVLIMAYNNKKEDVWQRGYYSLEKVNSVYPNSVMIAINTKGNDTTSLKPQGWNYTLETMKYIC